MSMRWRSLTVTILAVAGMWATMAKVQPGEPCGTPVPSYPGTVEPPLAACPPPPLCGPLPAPRPQCVEGSPDPHDPPTPIVKVRVRVPACAAAGQELEYRIVVENCAPAAAHHVLVRNPLPANARLVRASPEPTTTRPELQWKLGTLPGGACREIILVLAPTGPTDLTNCTRVQFEHGQCVTTRIAGLAPGEKIGKPPIRPPVVVEGGRAKLALTMSGPDRQYLDQPAQYFITVTNTGSDPAQNVMITNILPEKTTFVKAGQDGKFVDNQTAWLLGTLAPGASRTVEIVLRAREAGKICNQATVVADGGLKASAEACTVFTGLSALTLDLSDRDDPMPVGGETSYLITVLNQGSVPLTGIRLKAIIPPAMVLTRAKGPVDHKLGDKTPDGSQVLLFEPLGRLEAGGKGDFEVFVKALRPGTVRFKMELTADQLTRGPVHREESTTIYSENGPAPPAGPQTRRKTLGAIAARLIP
jgi:uncharacterized repeat protein (TIGR01451 family)